MEHDVVVVGAGPGGSNFARVAALNNLDILVLEKRNEIGAPKRCGEGLSNHAIERVGIKPNKEWIAQEIDGVYIFAPNGKRVDANYKGAMGHTIERKIFDRWIACQAADAGAKILCGTRATGLIKDGDRITGIKIKTKDGSTKDVKAKIVVAADGVESKVARWAGINSTNKLEDICSGVQFEMSNITHVNQRMLEVYMGTEIAPGGYVWVFPKGEKRANVGIGIRSMYANGKTALEYLKAFVNSHENLKKGSILEINGGGIPVGYPLEQLALAGFMVIGDAAHQVNAIHGGGIGEAMEAGKIAAEVAAKSISAGKYDQKSLSEYDKNWRQGPGVRLKKLVTLRKVIEHVSDKELNSLADQLSGNDIVELAKANKFSFLAKLLAKNPRMLRFVPKLLSA